MKLRHLQAALLLALAGCGQQASQPAAAQAENVLHDPRRIVALEGGRNFRDLGGYRTADGQQVQWGKLYRSGSPEHLTQDDFSTLDRLKIRMVCDLRSTRERAGQPNRWAEASDIQNWSRDYVLDMPEIASALAAKEPSARLMREAMLADYRAMPETQAESYKALFRNLANGMVPLMVNCSAGKDRTGLAAALTLAMLGVPMETVLRDYALSDKIVDYPAEMKKDAATNPVAARLAAMRPEVVAPLLASDPAYIESAFAEIRDRYGSLDAYFEQRLAVTPSMRAAIRRNLLEPQV